MKLHKIIRGKLRTNLGVIVRQKQEGVRQERDDCSAQVDTLSRAERAPRTITEVQIEDFAQALHLREKRPATIQKYVYSVWQFALWLDGRPVTQQNAIAYKTYLKEELCRRSQTVNTVVAALNSFFKQQGWTDLRLSSLKVQQRMFLDEDKLLTKAEYLRLVAAAEQRGNERLYYLLQTLCSTGIRISELRAITVEAVKRKKTEIYCKGKVREVMLPDTLCEGLTIYLQKQGIEDGPVFITRNNRELNRSNIWREMKSLCAAAGVEEKKVFPHNLRHLFARTFYAQEKDIVKLADILGHSNMQTTRIYTRGTIGQEHARLNRMGLTVKPMARDAGWCAG